MSAVQLTLDRIESEQHATRDENLQLHDQLTAQGKLQSDLSKSLLEADKYRSLYEVLRDEKFVGASQKSVTSRGEHGRDDKGDWDGTGNDADTVCTSDKESAPNSDTVDSASASTSPDSGNAVSDQAFLKVSGPYRQSMKYHTMKAEARIFHKCDLSRIPSGSTIIKTELRSTGQSTLRMHSGGSFGHGLLSPEKRCVMFICRNIVRRCFDS